VTAGRAALKRAGIGHNDDLGGADFNLTLSRPRAQAVAGRGVERARLRAEGRGLTQPPGQQRQ